MPDLQEVLGYRYASIEIIGTFQDRLLICALNTIPASVKFIFIKASMVPIHNSIYVGFTLNILSLYNRTPLNVHHCV